MKQHDPEERGGQNVEKGAHCSTSAFSLSTGANWAGPSESFCASRIREKNQSLNLESISKVPLKCAEAHTRFRARMRIRALVRDIVGFFGPACIYFLANKPLNITTLL